MLGAGGLKTTDTRRWQSGPHVSRSLEYLHAVFDYLDAIDVRVYRMSSQLIPYGTHPDLPQFDYRRQLDDARVAVDHLAEKARRMGLRLSTHPGQYTVMNALDDSIVAKAIADIEANAFLLDVIGQPPEAAIVIHVGGAYTDRTAALDRWVHGWERLSDAARARVALENDEVLFGLADVLELHRRTGVRVVLDVHHHRLLGARDWALSDALAAAASTWPAGVRPKIHLSSVSTMLRDDSPKRTGSIPPMRNHADLVSPWDLMTVVEALPEPADVMLEAKAKDLAVLQLRSALVAVSPEVAQLEERTTLT